MCVKSVAISERSKIHGFAKVRFPLHHPLIVSSLEIPSCSGLLSVSIYCTGTCVVYVYESESAGQGEGQSGTTVLECRSLELVAEYRLSMTSI